MKLNNIIKSLDKKMLVLKEEVPIGLADGKMGNCIYLYYTSRITNNNEYEQKAEFLISKLFEQIINTKVFDIKNGLAGIGLGIDHLIENKFLEGDTNIVLKDIDDELFKQICNTNILNSQDLSLQLQLIYYFSIRMKTQRKNSENEYLFREAIINAINFISEKICQFFEDEPISFNIENISIQSLLVLNKCGGLYRNKVNRILKDLSPNILSKIPVLHANKLYLLYAMNKINKKNETKGWDEHIKLLLRELSMENIIENELTNEIYFSNGLSAIYILLSNLGKYFTLNQTYKYKKIIIDKIEHSPIWNKLLDDENYLKLKSGLFSGYTGVSLLLQNHYKDENKLN